MPDSDLVHRVERLSAIIPQIIRHMQRVPVPAAPTPAISLPQLRVLLILDMEGDSTMGDLARRAGVTMPTATSSVDALVEGRHVTRRRSARDRRVVLVSLTAKGKKVIEALHEQRREQWRVILAGLGPDEQKQLLDAFETILRLLRQIDEPHEAAEGRGPKPNA